jgi:hypothetical protein
MTEKKAKTATPHLRETPEQRQQVEHEDAIEDAGKDGKDLLNSAFLNGAPPYALRSAYDCVHVRAEQSTATWGSKAVGAWVAEEETTGG